MFVGLGGNCRFPELARSLHQLYYHQQQRDSTTKRSYSASASLFVVFKTSGAA
jgi:hypothetical protein